MKKTLKTLVLSVLTCNLLVGSLSTMVSAEEGVDDTPVQSEPVTPPAEGGDTGTDDEVTPPVESTPEESIPEESVPEESTPEESIPEESEESSSEESSSEESSSEESSVEEEPTPTPPVVPTYPEYPSGSYIPPRVTPRTPVTSTEETTDETTVADDFETTANLDNLTNLLASSLDDENFVAAWEDYQVIIKDFDLKDIKVEESTGSTLSEILETFEGNTTPEEVTTEDGEKTLVFNYGTEELAEGATPVQIVLFGDENDNLVGAALLQASTTQYSATPLATETIQGLFLRPNSDLYANNPAIKGVYQVFSNDVTYTTVATPSVDQATEELIIMDNQVVLNHVTSELSETSLLFKLKELSTIFIDSLDDTETPEESADSEEGSEGTDSEAETDEEVNPFVQRFAPTNYVEDSITDYEQLSTGYQELVAMIQEGTLTVTDEQIVDLLGEPANKTEGGASVYYSYYSIEEERIILFDIQVDKNSNVVTNMKYDNRTPELDAEFPINIEELFALAEADLSLSNLISSLGEPNIVEHIFAGGHQTRNVWTSYTDPEMRNVEAYEDTATGKVELYYYDQD